MGTFIGAAIGFFAWFFVRYLMFSLFTVDQNERAVKTSFGRAQRLRDSSPNNDPVWQSLPQDERERYDFPRLKVLPPGGPYYKLPWERVYKVSIATQTVSMAFDPENADANSGGAVLEAVTKDQLNTGMTGQIRYKISERNLYAYLFGVKNPIVHVMGYFISVLRERIANFEAPAAGPGTSGVQGVSINDLRKNLRDLNDHMDKECQSSSVRYGIEFDASLITGIDPPPDVESALAAINTAHNHVSSEISVAQAAADQKIVQSHKAVEIEGLRVDAEVAPLMALAAQLQELKRSGPQALTAYLRSVRLGLFSKAGNIVTEVKR